MGRRLRYLPPDSTLVEITVRTVQGRFLLKPTPGFREVFIGALARAQSLYPVAIHALACLSNHLHLLVSPEDAHQLARFMRHFNTNLSKEAARLHDWSGPLLHRRYQAISVSAEESAQIGRLRYILEQGCKEDLVAKPSDWPGAHCAHALCENQPLQGIWFNRTAEYNARRSGKSFRPEDYAVHYELELASLPCWAALPPATHQRYLREIVQQIESETRERHRINATRPLGRRAILQQDPHTRPERPKKSPAPTFHAASRKVRTQLHAAYAAFVESFRAAAESLRMGAFPVNFPSGAFPPSSPFARPDPIPI